MLFFLTPFPVLPQLPFQPDPLLPVFYYEKQVSKG